MKISELTFSQMSINSAETDERALVERAKSDSYAFGLLFDKYYDDIYRYILHRTANPSLAHELTSDTFYIVLQKLWQFRWKGIPFAAWLYRIATNELNSYFRKRKNRRSISLDEINEDRELPSDQEKHKFIAEEEEILKNEVFHELHKTITELDKKYQEVIVLRFFEDRQIKDISLILGKAEGTVKSLLHRGLNILREKIDTSLYEEFRYE